MANIFHEAWNVVTSRWHGGGTSKKEAQTIMQNIGVLEEDEELEDDYVFDYQNWKEPINDLELWDGYSVGEHGKNVATVWSIGATMGVGSLLSDIGLSSEILGSSDASEEVAEEVLEDEISSNDVVRKWSYLLPFAVLLLFVL